MRVLQGKLDVIIMGCCRSHSAPKNPYVLLALAKMANLVK